jgi:hypothetical protein
VTTPTVSHRHTATTIVQEDASEVPRCTETIGAGYVRTYAATCTSILDGQAQHLTAAGVDRTMRGQKGAAGFVGGTFSFGGGEGGTPGTNLPGYARALLGETVGGFSGPFSFWTGPPGGETERASYYLIPTGVGFFVINAGPYSGSATTGLFLNSLDMLLQSNGELNIFATGAGGNILVSTSTGLIRFLRSGSDAFFITLDNLGLVAHNAVATVTAVEHQHNTSPRLSYDSANVTLSGDKVIRENAAGTKFGEDVATTAFINTATTTYILTYATTTDRVYDVWAHDVASNDDDDEGASHRRVAVFRNVAGTLTQIGTTKTPAAGLGGLDVLDFEDAGQAGLDLTIDFSGTSIRVGYVTPSGDEVRINLSVSIKERVRA